MNEKIRNFLYIIRNDGIGSVIVKVLVRYGLYETQIVEARRVVNEHIKIVHESIIAYGPFKGMSLSQKTWWGTFDYASKILGTYETQLIDKIISLSEPDTILIDVGAADGFFAIGLLRGGFFKRAECFEISPKGHEVIMENAIRNGVAEGISLHGKAEAAEILQIMQQGENVVLLCDIEGAEFDLFDDNTLKGLQGSRIVIELHPHKAKDGKYQREALIERAGRYFTVDFLKRSPIPVGDFDELSHFNDNERMLAFSEGRGEAGEWLVLT